MTAYRGMVLEHFSLMRHRRAPPSDRPQGRLKWGGPVPVLYIWKML